MKRLTVGLFVLVVLVLPRGAAAAGVTLGLDPPAGLLVSAGGLEWAWAAPCAPVEPSCGVVVLHHGFFIPGAAEWNASFPDLASLVAAFNAPQLCASPYFSVAHDHCDSGDLLAGGVWGAPFASPGLGDHPLAEAFLARRAVPEPISLVLFGSGLAGVALRKRKIRR